MVKYIEYNEKKRKALKHFARALSMFVIQRKAVL